MNKITALFFLNLTWFGFFFYMIAFIHISIWWIIFPVLIHWKVSDFKEKKDEE